MALMKTISKIITVSCLALGCATQNQPSSPISSETLKAEILNQYVVNNSAAAGDYLSALTRRVALGANLSYLPNIILLQEEAPLAFSLPSSEVFISTGMVKKVSSEAELAFIVAHELGHAVLRHHGKESTDGSFEIEADKYAAEVLSNAGYDPTTSLTALLNTYGADGFVEQTLRVSNVGRHAFYHPTLKARLSELRGRVVTLKRIQFSALNENMRAFQIFKVAVIS